jgi:hypothetical protein
MATMYPSPIPEIWAKDQKRQAEIQVYQALDNSLDDSWHVFWSVSWTLKRRNTAYDYETDFVVCHPEHGVLLIEVKGGRISKDGSTETWISTDRFGKNHPIRNPAKQVQEAMYGLKKKLDETFHWEPNMGRAVAFPHCLYDAKVIDIDRDFIIDMTDLDNLRARILDIARFWKRKLEMVPFSLPQLQFLKSCLASSFSLSSPLDLQIGKAEKRILKLTEEQFEILYQLNGNRRMGIRGGAGTGKTILAVEKAKRLAAEGFEVLLTCVSRDLEHYLQRCMGAPVERLTILPFEELCRIISEEGGIPVAGRREGQTIADYRENTLPKQLLDGLEKTSRRFDAILVDEAQDFDTHWWTALETCLRSQSDGIFWVFFDDNQNVYDRPSCVPPNSFVFSLTKNFRNTREIFRLSSIFYRGEKLTSIGTDGPPVDIVHIAHADNLHEEVVKKLDQLFGQGINPADIAVLTPKPLDVSPLYRALRGNPPAKPTDFERKANNVMFQSIPNFKGLERSVVIVCEIDDMTKEEAVPNLYVGLSRAKTHLVVIGTKATLARHGIV